MNTAVLSSATKRVLRSRVPAPEAKTLPGALHTRRVRVWYDFQRKIIGLRDLKTQKVETREAILLKNVTFVVEGGERYGCQGAGYLGFAEGDESFDSVPESFDASVRFKKDNFFADDRAVRSASALHISATSMRATGCVPL